MFNFEAEVSKAHAAAAGWTDGIMSNTNPFTSVVFYLMDYRREEMALFSIEEDNFYLSRVPEDKCESTLEEHNATLLQRPLTAEEVRAYTIAMASQVKRTETYRRYTKERTSKERLHCLIIIYPPIEGNTPRLRVAITQSTRTVMEPGLVREHSNHVLEYDRANKPEWFADLKSDADSVHLANQAIN